MEEGYNGFPVVSFENVPLLIAVPLEYARGVRYKLWEWVGGECYEPSEDTPEMTHEELRAFRQKSKGIRPSQKIDNRRIRTK